MKSAIRPTTRSRRANARRPAVPPRDFKDLSSFEKIVLGCMVPAKLIFDHLDETEPYSRSWTEENNRLGLIYLALAEMALGLCVGTVVWCVLKGIALVLRKVQRPKYYPQERLRRQALARERRRIRRRTTLNAAPTADELLAQWAKVKRNPEEMIRFGSMLCDLEAYVDNSLLRNENGEIVGRNPGIRGWLNANCQPLAVHYKTVMGYKAMAEKFRQAVGLADPYPAAFALDDGTGGATPTVEDARCQNMVRKSDGDHRLPGPPAPDGHRPSESLFRPGPGSGCPRQASAAPQVLRRPAPPAAGSCSTCPGAGQLPDPCLDQMP